MTNERIEAAAAAPGCGADRVWAEFLAALAALAPEVRAAFLLHEVFEADYEAIARLTGQPAELCRRHVEQARACASARMRRLGQAEQVPPP